jgi:hypothetical protein
MTQPHPIYTRLVAPTEQPFSRHAVLHDMQREAAQLGACASLAARVSHFVDRGVPYFAPGDAHYRAWAEKAAQLWDEVHAGVPV